MSAGTFVLAVLCGIAAGVVMLMAPLRVPVWERATIAAALAAGVMLLVVGVAGMSGDTPATESTVTPGAGVHPIEPPGPSGGVR